ncbi:hypothetical protein ACX3X3_13380 [Bacillus subtilis]|uniref:hypothetical protein n=1 Tax=Bacillus subtilis TaxID=1423 RepID=UPI0011C8DBE0|nr:hypothetical protein [Bacillus subtilis]TXK63681.1 hypothetical protein FVD40_04870 [Bacillus subtilis]HEQ3553535.1 hypothetical protein [Enterococcus faecalis]
MLVNKPQFDEEIFKYDTPIAVTEATKTWNGLVVDNCGTHLTVLRLTDSLNGVKIIPAHRVTIYASKVDEGKIKLALLVPKENEDERYSCK